MLKQQKIKVFLVIEYKEILETDTWGVIVENIDAWQNSRKINANKVSETNYKIIKEFWG